MYKSRFEAVMNMEALSVIDIIISGLISIVVIFEIMCLFV